MHQAWKDLATSQGASDDHLKSTIPNGTSLGVLNGTGLGVNPLIQGSLLGLNGLTQDTFPLGLSIYVVTMVTFSLLFHSVLVKRLIL